jgi:outer membrane protein, heavy metal efflux system
MRPSPKIHRLLRVGLPVLLAVVAPDAVTAQGLEENATQVSSDTLRLTLAEAQLHALANNPELRAARRLSDAASGRLRQAGVYPFNPEILIESEQVGKGRATEAYEGEVSQEIEWAGQRGLRKRAAEYDLASADFTVRDAERLTRASTAAAFYSVLAAESRVALAEDIRSLNEQLVSAVSDLLDAGSISLLEANLARIESGRARTRVLEERRDTRTALLELRRVLGLDDTRPLRLSPDVPVAPDPADLDPDSLVRSALTRRPDVGAATSDIEARRSFVRLARRERLPNLRLSLPFNRLDGPGSEQVGLGFGLSIPLWNRSQGTVEELGAVVARAEAGRDAVELAVRTEVVDAYQRYVSAREEERIAATSVLQPAQFNQPLLDEAFRSGKIGLSTLLLIRNQLLDAELDYWESWLELRLELVRLTAVTADPLPNQ